MSRKSYLNAGKTIKLCRVCLTQSNNVMYDLTEDTVVDGTEEMPILEALEKVVSVKVMLDEDFPRCICPICVSILKMAFKFVTQFEEAQRKLKQKFEKSSIGDSHDSNIVPETQKGTVALAIMEGDSAPVEIIFGQNKFDLKDIIVVEEVEKEQFTFRAFLKNLGREVSATFADKYKTKPDVQVRKENAVSIYMKDGANGILPVRELKIDDSTNDIDYIVVEDVKPEIVEKTENNNMEYAKIETLNRDVDSLIIQSKSENEDETLNDDVDSLIIETKSENEDESLNDDIEFLIVQPRSEDDDKIEYLIDQKDIESLIIENERCEINKENNTVDHPRNQKVIKAGKRKKLIDEQKLKDIVIMGPVNGEVEELNEKNDEDDIFEREIQFPCEICKKIFSNNRALTAHKRRTHFPKERQFTCEICGYKNNTRSGYVHHKNKHFGKQFTCEICDKTYYTRAVLKVHMATHVNKRQHLCSVCGKGFNYANALIYHMRLHTGERNYNCEYCGEKFRMPNSLKRHVRIHTGERPYKCRFCDRAFCSRGEVQCHENIHTGYRPYHCKHCMKGFTKTHNLKLHLLKHEGPHECEICGKSFIEMTILSMHYKIAHKDLLEMKKEDELDEQS